MSIDRLTLNERCVLFVLMAEARELTNAELHEAAGIKLPSNLFAERVLLRD